MSIGKSSSKIQVTIHMVRTRIAPSPTGFPHIGTIYQALFNYAFAKKHSGQFIVRVEDTDVSRFVEGAEDAIYKALDWFSLQENESPRQGGRYAPYKQSERLNLYKMYAKKLIASGYAYYCDCMPERLDEVRRKMQAEGKAPMYDRYCRGLNKTEGVIRLKIPENTRITVRDEIRGEIEFDSNTIDDQILIKSDGFPTYHLAVVVDDHEMEITHIVRGEEWLSSTPKHVLLYQYFGWKMPAVYHTAALRNPDHSKLSKRQGHTKVSWYQDEGFLPEAILNFLALLGWSHPEEKEIFTTDEFISLFDLKDIRPVGPVFDVQKLMWMNGLYIREKLTSQELKKRLLPFNPELQEIKTEEFIKYIEIAKTRMKTLKDFNAFILPFILPVEKILSEKEEILKAELKSILEKQDSWTIESLNVTLLAFLKKHEIRFPVLYKIVIGREKGLPLADVFGVLGKEKVLHLLS